MGNTKRSSLIIIKLGGSIITYKDSPVPKTRTKTISNLSKELSQLHQKGFQLIIIHGAGSFGHPLAKKYKLTEGLKHSDSLIGFSKTANAMIKLNKIIIGHMIDAGLPAVTLPPRSFITQTNGAMNSFDCKVIEALIENKIVPVLFGDVVFDTKLGCSIISGDTITPYLAKELKAKKVIFLTDVDGILNDDPRKNPSAKLIEKVTNKNLDQVLKGLKPTSRDDVTGEMLGKILELKKNLTGVRIHIANGLKSGNLTLVTQNEPVGTVIYFD